MNTSETISDSESDLTSENPVTVEDVRAQLRALEVRLSTVEKAAPTSGEYLLSYLASLLQVILSAGLLGWLIYAAFVLAPQHNMPQYISALATSLATIDALWIYVAVVKLESIISERRQVRHTLRAGKALIETATSVLSEREGDKKKLPADQKDTRATPLPAQ